MPQELAAIIPVTYATHTIIWGAWLSYFHNRAITTSWGISGRLHHASSPSNDRTEAYGCFWGKAKATLKVDMPNHEWHEQWGVREDWVASNVQQCPPWRMIECQRLYRRLGNPNLSLNPAATIIMSLSLWKCGMPGGLSAKVRRWCTECCRVDHTLTFKGDWVLVSSHKWAAK